MRTTRAALGDGCRNGNGGLATIEASDGSLEYVRERKAANARVA